MSLDEEIRKIIAEGRCSILVVDDACDIDAEKNQAYHEHIPNEENCEMFAGKNGVRARILDTGRARALNWPEYRLKNFGLVLVRAKSALARFGLKEEVTLLSRLAELSPAAAIVYCIPDIDATVNKASKNMVELLLDKRVSVEPVNYDCFPTLMHALSHAMTGIVFYNTPYGMSAFRTPRNTRSISATQHEYKNRMWKDFYVNFIDESLRAGNSQTEQKYHFLILSNREILKLGEYSPTAEEKVVVKPSDYALTEEDLKNCAAIFIDNEWNEHPGALGEGINTLRRVRAQLGEQKIPLIYVTGTDLSQFSDDEKAEIRRNGAVLVEKDSFPKVATKEKAEREIAASKMLECNEQLAKYTVRVVPELIGQNDMYVICSKIAEEREDKTKKELFARMNIEDETYNHRMYVLALWHEAMKGKEFERKQMFKKFDELSDRCGGIEKYRELYEKALKNPDLHEITTISHNDAKEDNWFGGALGDYGDVSAGNEYKDIARALMNGENAERLSWVNERIENYRLFRGANADSERFARNVYSMIFVEALREGSKKGDGKLLKVAERYAGIIKPIIGE